MNINELEKLGFVHVGAKIYPRRFLFPSLNEEMNIPESYTVEDVLLMLHKLGYDAGVERGKELKVEEIKSVLMIGS